ncbi:MAG: phosphatase PAP2 family protein [Acidobacteria bacterium]|nr:phosphatase PAP2 family protein [Acidobacteriota bacterium]
MNTKRSKHFLGPIVLFLLWVGLTPPALAQDNVVLQWNQAALQAVRNTRMGPPMVARSLAVIHTCAYDAWSAYDPVATGTRLGGTLRRPIDEHTLANKQKAISFAAYRALVDLFPSSQHAMFRSLMNSLGYNPDDMTTDTSDPAGIGNVAATAVIAFRHNDGSNQLGDLLPGAYSDYTFYRPVNSAGFIRDPNRWEPLLLLTGQVQSYLAPHWGRVIPFAMNSATPIQPEKAPAFYINEFLSFRYRQQAFELIYISANLGDREKMISEYWADGPATETPPGHWCLLAQTVSRREGHSLDDDVKMYFALTNGLLDASIAAWECKRVYDYVRPITAIRFLYQGQRISAWGGPFQGRQFIFGEDWKPYQMSTFITPPFAEYVSGHSTFSSTSAEILKLYTGSDDFGASVILPAGSSRIEPGLTPADPITLSWATFTVAAEEAGISRLYGGIHFMDGNIEGRKMGRKIGALVWEKAQSYFNGTATVN